MRGQEVVDLRHQIVIASWFEARTVGAEELQEIHVLVASEGREHKPMVSTEIARC